MEYIMITKSKLKVICEREELLPFGVSANHLDCALPEARRFLDSVLERAKRDFGFDTEKYRILAQLYPSRDGGCEIFISRLGLISQSDAVRQEESDENSMDLAKEKSEKNEKTEKNEKSKKRKKTKKLFFFERVDFLLEVCKRLSLLDFKGRSEAFYLKERGYYLCVELELDSTIEEYALPVIDEFSFILEYGEPEATSLAPYLYEYALLLCSSDAVNRLAKI